MHSSTSRELLCLLFYYFLICDAFMTFIEHKGKCTSLPNFERRIETKTRHTSPLVMMGSSDNIDYLRPSDLLPSRLNKSRSMKNLKSKQQLQLKASITNKTMSNNRQSFAIPFLLPWSLWMNFKSELKGSINEESDKNTKRNKKNRRRWEIPLTSKPFEGFEFLQSTVLYCSLAIAIYFFMGTLLFPAWLEPNWTFIDALYFSMTTLTTVGYGDLVPNHQSGIFGKIFLLFFNLYAVCISVSALGVIAKLALTKQKMLISKAKERARNELMKIFDAEDKGIDEQDDEEELDDEECLWIDNILDDKCISDEALSIPKVFLDAVKNHSFNFSVLLVIAVVLRRIENWSLVDLLYYWNGTATTIGFGDVAPKTQLGRLIAVFFVPLSVVTLGEVIANCFAFITSRASSKAEKDFLRREITLSDLEYLDIDDDGKVNEMDFITFMLIAMQKVDKKTMRDVRRLFNALDVGKDGFIQKEDLIILRQRKRVAKRLRREAKKNKKNWYIQNDSM